MLRDIHVHSKFRLEVRESAVITDGSRGQHPMCIRCLPKILADQLTDISRDAGQDCRIRAAVHLNPAEVLLAFQHPQNCHHVLAPHQHVLLQAVLVDLIDGDDHVIDHLEHRLTQLHGLPILRHSDARKDGLEQPFIQSFQLVQQVRETTVFLLGFGNIVLEHISQRKHIISAQLHTVGAVGSIDQLVCFIDNDIIAILQQIISAAGFQLLGHQEHIMVGHLDIARSAPLATLYIDIVLTHDPLRAVPTGAANADLLL